MNSTDTPADQHVFEVHLPPVPLSKWQREYRAFQRLLPQLLATHRGKYVAIHEERVVDEGDDEIALALRVFRKVGAVPIHVGLVTEEPPAPIRIPHYRLATNPTEPIV